MSYLLLRFPRLLVAAGLAALGLPALGMAQVMEGRLAVQVSDPSGGAIPALVRLAGRSPEFVATVTADETGHAVLKRLRPGQYRLTVSHAGFEDLSRRVEIRSAVPQSVQVVLEVGTPHEELTVEDSAPLLDPLQPSNAMQVGRMNLNRTPGTTLGRSTIDVVTTLPGWLLEANAVLHPRGSEYDTQYVIDGMPLYDNRSIAFAPAFENDEFEAVNVLTAGIPAEYGRRLGGVIALDTRRAERRGHRTALDLQAGGYGTWFGSMFHQFAADRTSLSLGLQAGNTDRYLDPPSIENFTNRASAGGVNARLAHDLSPRDQFTAYLRYNRTGFLVPNDLEQQAAGQRQDRRMGEMAGQIHYQRTISPSTLGSIRGMIRDLSSELWSNPLATPVHVQQDRGFREAAVVGGITVDHHRHTLKFGGDVRINDIRETFLLSAPGELSRPDLAFQEERRSTELGLFVQDQIRLGNFATTLGVRFDAYSLLVEETAVSPRAAVSYYVPQAEIQLFASYDRIFQPPPMENLLLSSGASALEIDAVEGTIPVPASRANFFEIGLRKTVANVLRLDLNHYWRTFRNYIDDDVFLNTGVSFPITFDTARIEGTEVRLELPRWRRVSSFVSYSNLLGRATSPVTGGLFIEGGEAEELRDVVERFPISQDQRNTVATRFLFDLHRRVWLGIGARYGSGLPVELADDDDDDEGEDEEEGEAPDSGADDERFIAPEILARVNFERARVRPNFSLDLSVGARLWEADAQSVSIQFDVRNLTDRLNVINFNGLFSGTALAPGRLATVRLKMRF
ncbi:MAG: TonB-dependent receptor [Acidobacteriota bacterium]|nr:TonB-dependent receptor [Acidobacteriota bacterium]